MFSIRAKSPHVSPFMLFLSCSSINLRAQGGSQKDLFKGYTKNIMNCNTVVQYNQTCTCQKPISYSCWCNTIDTNLIDELIKFEKLIVGICGFMPSYTDLTHNSKSLHFCLTSISSSTGLTPVTLPECKNTIGLCSIVLKTTALNTI